VQSQKSSAPESASKASQKAKTIATSASVKGAARTASASTESAAGKGGASKVAQRIIKKYPNRRLYDTDTSTYITLTEVKQLVLDARAFVVRDAKTNEDLTRSILLQIILEEESGGVPMFTETVLSNIIRFYGHAMQGFVGNYLETNVQSMMDMQSKMAEQVSQSGKPFTPEMWTQFMSPQSPAVQNIMGQSSAMLAQMQEQMKKQTEQMLSAFGLKR
jgi:polyhydroxyalkanoate synthesis repressor PhaR